MRIDAVDFFYLAMPEIRDVGDGSQDVLLVRVRADDGVGWGECEACRIGGIGPSAAVAEYATRRGIGYVNHTFTSQLALAASLYAFAGMADSALAEYPAEPSPLAAALTDGGIEPDDDGTIGLPEAPGSASRRDPRTSASSSWTSRSASAAASSMRLLRRSDVDM